jgi:hypothetical protein
MVHEYKLFAEHCLGLAEKAKSAIEKRALLTMAWWFTQLVRDAVVSEKPAQDFAQKRAVLIEHLLSAMAMANELGDAGTMHRIERLIEEATSGSGPR